MPALAQKNPYGFYPFLALRRFLVILLVSLAIITYWPDLSLWLVRFVGV